MLFNKKLQKKRSKSSITSDCFWSLIFQIVSFCKTSILIATQKMHHVPANINVFEIQRVSDEIRRTVWSHISVAHFVRTKGSGRLTVVQIAQQRGIWKIDCCANCTTAALPRPLNRWKQLNRWTVEPLNRWIVEPLKTVEQFSAAGRLNLPVAKLACCYARTNFCSFRATHFLRIFYAFFHVEPLNRWTVKPLNRWTVEPLNRWKQLNRWTVEPLNR